MVSSHNRHYIKQISSIYWIQCIFHIQTCMYNVQYTCATIGYTYELLQWAQCGVSFSTIEMGSVTLLKEPCIFSIIIQNVSAHLNKQSDFFTLTHPLPDSVMDLELNAKYEVLHHKQFAYLYIFIVLYMMDITWPVLVIKGWYSQQTSKMQLF